MITPWERRADLSLQHERHHQKAGWMTSNMQMISRWRQLD
jgi:hypothetical protein